MPYWRLHYHLVWATFKREPMIDSELEQVIHSSLYGKAKELGLIIHSVGNIEDHIHLVVSIPPTVLVSDCLRHFKGASSFTVNRMPGSHSHFKWQEGYGAISIGERSLANVIAYVKNQKQHHRDKTEIDSYEYMVEDYDGPRVQGRLSRLEPTSKTLRRGIHSPD